MTLLTLSSYSDAWKYFSELVALYLIQFMVAESFKILYFIYNKSQVRLKCESLIPIVKIPIGKAKIGI